MTLQATELMHNDWYSGLNASNERDSFQFDIYDLDFWGDCEPQPIPLTPEILKANGFQDSIDKDDVEWYLKQNSYPYEDWGYTFEHNVFEYEYIGLSVRKQLYYVHEFQHALRLCGLSELADNFKIE